MRENKKHIFKLFHNASLFSLVCRWMRSQRFSIFFCIFTLIKHRRAIVFLIIIKAISILLNLYKLYLDFEDRKCILQCNNIIYNISFPRVTPASKLVTFGSLAWVQNSNRYRHLNSNSLCSFRPSFSFYRILINLF